MFYHSVCVYSSFLLTLREAGKTISTPAAVMTQNMKNNLQYLSEESFFVLIREREKKADEETT